MIFSVQGFTRHVVIQKFLFMVKVCLLYVICYRFMFIVGLNQMYDFLIAAL
jgi:hypothetical protein